MWQEVRLWHDPWFVSVGVFGSYPLNAYGPLFNTLAIPDYFNPVFSKLLFSWAYLLFAIWLIKRPDQAERVSTLGTIVLLIWLWNPFVWVEIANYGHFDVLVGICSVGALAARIQRRDIVSGICLGIGVLLKYIPIVLLPFLILDEGRILPRRRLLYAATAVILLGMGISQSIWGVSVYRPIAFAVERRSDWLSIWRFLHGTHSPLVQHGYAYILEYLYRPILFLALLRAWSWSRLSKVDIASSAVLAILVTLMFYRVGFPQYQMVLFVLASYWIISMRDEIRQRTPLLVALGCYFGWYALFDLGESTRVVIPDVIQDWVGLPTFLLAVALLVCVVRSATTELTRGDTLVGAGLRKEPTSGLVSVETQGAAGMFLRDEGNSHSQDEHLL
jgi:hypothetical protein